MSDRGRLVDVCERPGCTASYARLPSYRDLPPYCSHACQRLGSGFPVTDHAWKYRRLRDCDLETHGSGFTMADIERLLARYKRTGNVTPARSEVVDSPANNIHHRRIRDEQLRLIADTFERRARPRLRKVV